MNNWSKRLRAGLTAKGLRYKDIADVFGITVSAVGHWTSGRREPSLDQIMILCKMLDIDIHELLGEDPVFTDAEEIQAAQLMKHIPKEQRETALKILETFAKE